MVEIRQLAVRDWATLRQVRLRALQESPSAFGSRFEDEAAFDDEVWRTRVADAVQLVAVADGEYVGTAAGVVRPPETGREWTLVGVWVADEYRGRGIARPLVQAVLDAAKRSAVTRVHLAVVVDNDRARELYARMGFVAVGEPHAMARDASSFEQAMVLDWGG